MSRQKGIVAILANVLGKAQGENGPAGEGNPRPGSCQNLMVVWGLGFGVWGLGFRV